MNLPRLSGYLKFPDGFPAAPVTLVPRRWPRMAEGFIARAFGSAPGAHAADEPIGDPSEWASLPAEAADGAPAAIDAGAGQPVVPAQTGSAQWREGGCQTVVVSGVDVTLK